MPARIDVDFTNGRSIGAMFEMVRVPIKGTPTDFGDVTLTCRGGASCPPESMSIALNFMTYDPEKHHRRSIRLKGFDYSRSAVYFVTICVQNRECLFGTISQHKMLLNDAGGMVSAEWLALPSRFCSVILDEFVVMPNHFHGIIYISPDSSDNPTLGKILGAFKSIVNNNYITGVKDRGWTPFAKRLWQRNYYEHIVRDDSALQKIQQYIRDNPLTWQIDSLDPDVQIQY
jgi:putative transposase